MDRPAALKEIFSFAMTEESFCLVFSADRFSDAKIRASTLISKTFIELAAEQAQRANKLSNKYPV